jgi:hypothetical protein
VLETGLTAAVTAAALLVLLGNDVVTGGTGGDTLDVHSGCETTT